MILESLKTLYDGKPLSEIQEQCERYKSLSQDNRKDFILTLYYLQRTNRFRENPIYAKATFEQFIGNCFNLRFATYNKERMAFIAHPKAAAKWGAGLIEKIRSECGAGKINDVVKQIEATENVNHTKIDKIIEKNAKPKKEKPVVDTKKTLESERARNVKTIADYIRTISEQDEQIKKLKATVIARDSEIAALYEEIESLMKENESLKSNSKNVEFRHKAMYQTLNDFMNGLRHSA